MSTEPIIHALDIPEVETGYPAPFDGERFSRGRDLGSALALRALGIWQERLEPGRRSSFTHAHSLQEEVIYVLSGYPHLRLLPQGGEASEHLLSPGDVVGFRAGTGLAHGFINRSAADVILLNIGGPVEGDQVRYPEDPGWEQALEARRAGRVWRSD